MLIARLAEMTDAEMLLSWRNDATTRAFSHSKQEISLPAHRQWLAGVLADPLRQLWVFEEAGVAVGTGRIDRESDYDLLSWTVAPAARGRGFAKLLLADLLKLTDRPVRAEIAKTNVASIKVAEYCGLNLTSQLADNTLVFTRR